MRLAAACRLIRSKNAGPFWLTFDVMFKDEALYRRAKERQLIDVEAVKAMFPGVADPVRVFYCDAASAIKFSFPRASSSGSVLDSDVFGGQQYAPLLDLELD